MKASASILDRSFSVGQLLLGRTSRSTSSETLELSSSLHWTDRRCTGTRQHTNSRAVSVAQLADVDGKKKIGADWETATAAGWVADAGAG